MQDADQYRVKTMITTQQIYRIGRWLAIINCATPLIAVLGAYAIGLWQQVIPVCNPFLDGCLSISRAARTGDAIFWFRGLMLPLVPLFAAYWLMQVYWLKQLVGRHTRELTTILWLGLASAFALLLYVNFLGSEGDFYRFMRRQGVMFYFGLAGLAQLYSLYVLNKFKPDIDKALQRRLRWQWGFVIGQWVLGLSSVIATILLPEYEYQISNAIEWQFALLMVGFYGVSGFIWHHWLVERTG